MGARFVLNAVLRVVCSLGIVELGQGEDNCFSASCSR